MNNPVVTKTHLDVGRFGGAPDQSAGKRDYSIMRAPDTSSMHAREMRLTSYRSDDDHLKDH